MKLYCCDCEKYFDENDIPNDDCCPHCGSENLDDTFECEVCGEIFPDSEKCYHEDFEGPLCKDCHHSENRKLSARKEYELGEFLLGWEKYKE